MRSFIKNHLTVFGCFIGLSILQFFIVRYTVSLVKHQSTGAYIESFFIMILFTALALWGYLKMAGKSTLHLSGVNWKTWLQLLLLCISNFLFVSVVDGYPVWIGKDNIPIGYIILSFYWIFCHSVVLEILFRGLLQKQLSKILKPWLAIFITTMVGVIVGLIYNQSLYYTLLAGIFIGIIYYKTDNLILCILYRSFSSLLYGIFHFSFEYGHSFQTAFFIFAVGLAVYSIRGFMKNNKQEVLINNSEK
jgi:membrane protease YdiL (CAAX protease family)